MEERNLYISSLFGGGAAGLMVDMTLFPLDTIKTRLQSKQGFWKAGGFQKIYRGIGPQAVGSIPQAAAFFCTYESFKHFVSPQLPTYMLPFVHMAGASVAEVVACLIRVPMEVVKQRRQISTNLSSTKILINTLKSEGVLKGLYRGFGSTVMREIPFSIIQFPILERLKVIYKNFRNDGELESYHVALCGALAGGIAAAATTPIDVIKTRIMLADIKLVDRSSLTIINMAKLIYSEKGLQGLFAGFVPRVVWITLGGCIFFGMYDYSKNLCSNYLTKESFVDS